MRYLFLILSFILFISSESKAVDLDMGDLRFPDTVPIWRCYINGDHFDMEDTTAPCQEAAQSACKSKDPTYNVYVSSQSESYIGYSCKNSSGFGYNAIAQAGKIRQITEPCSSRTDEYIYSVEFEGETMCAKPIEDPFGNCPEPTENDYPQFGTGGGQQEYCYTNPDGTQCKITTDSNGDFTLPYQYGTQEPSICHNEPVDTPDPDPMPDVPEVPDADDPTSDDNSQGDDTDKSTEIEAQNQINDNLTIINDSINTSSDSNSERLNLIKDNIDNSNLYLDSIEENTGKALGALQQQTALLAEIRDKEDKDKAISVNAERKTGGLNDLFNADKLTALKTESDQTQQDLKDYYSQIQTEIKSMFDLQINASGAYEERTMTIKGQTIDYGLGRFASFWQSLAPIVLFVFSCLALYAVLGGVRA